MVLGLNNRITNLCRNLADNSVSLRAENVLKLVKRNGLKMLLLCCVGLASAPVFASIGVAPTRIEVDANKVKGNYFSTAIEVRGDLNKPIRFKVYPEYFILNEKSELVISPKSADEYDISKKIKFLPSEFSVAPGKIQKVRVNIANINSLPNGESRAILFVEDVQPKEDNVPTGDSGIAAKLIVKTRIGVPVYIDKGKIVREADIEYLNIERVKDNLYACMKINTKGNSRVRYTGKLQIVQGKKLIDEFEISSGVVAQNGFFVDKNLIDVSKISSPGQYTLRLTLSYFDGNGKKQSLKKETILNIEGKM